MSNALAIATTTVALGDIVKLGIGGVTGAHVTTLRPDEKEDASPSPEANVFLYHIAPSASHRNDDLPTRGADGALRRRPQVALDLHYLISFYGDEAILEPQRLLGGAVSALHERPLVTAADVRAIAVASGTAPLTDPRKYLGDTDLDTQVDQVSFTPVVLNLEELSKLWSTLFRVRYVLSVAYRASVVLIESQISPRPPLPVRASNLYVLPVRRPAVERAEAEEGPQAPILAGGVLVISGGQLRGAVTRVRIGDAVATPEAGDVSDTRIRVALASPPFPAGALRAGVQGVQVLHPLELGTPPAEHRGTESNAAPFILRPRLVSATVGAVTGTGAAPRAATITVVADPPILARQRVVLLLDATAGDGAHSFPAARRDQDADPVEVPVEGVAAGTYLVRVQVDGAESLLEPETAPGPDQGRFVAPTLTLP